MKIKFIISLVFSAGLIVLSGCVNTPIEPAAAIWPTKDQIVDRYEKPMAQLVTATRVVLSRDGRLLVDNVVNNTFKAKINQHDVWVRVSNLDPTGKITVVTVQARGPVTGDVELAAEVSKQIALQLMAEQNQ